MKRFFFSFFVLICLSLTAMTVSAQNAKKVTVTGKALDESNNQPIEMMTVIANKGEQYAETNQNGEFTLYLNPADTFVIEFRLIDYETQILKVPYDGKTNKVVVNPKFKSLNITTGTVVVSESVTQKLEEATVSMTTVKPEQVQRMAATDLRDVMVQIPGVTMISNQISFRGSSGWTYGVGSRVVGLLNGLPISPGETGALDWYSLPVDGVQQVEVIKGASSVLYGTGAMGGVINVLTKDPGEKPETVIRFRTKVYDSPANPAADWDGSSSAVGYSMHLYHSRKIAQVWDFSVWGDYIRNNSFRQGEREKRQRFMVMNKFHIKKAPGLVLGLGGQVATDSTSENLFWDNYPYGALRPNPQFTTSIANRRWSIDPSISYVWKNMRILYQGRIFNRSYLYTPDTIWKGEPRKSDYKLKSRDYGSTVFYNDIQFKHSVWKDRLQLVEGVNYTRTELSVNRDFGTAHIDQIAGIFQAKLTLGRLSITVGARYQHEVITGDTSTIGDEKGASLDSNMVSMTTMSAPIFRGGINYHVGKATYLRASIGQAIRSPSINERFVSYNLGPILIVPNPDIRLEKGWTAEIGVRQLFQTNNGKLRGYADVALFTTQFRDMIEFYADEKYLFERQRVAFKAQNISSASIYGAELDAGAEWQITKDLKIGLMTGFTYIEPIDNNGDKNWNGDDSTSVIVAAAVSTLAKSDPLIGQLFNTYTSFPQDRPSILKYRNKLTTRSALSVTYKGFNFQIMHRYTSAMINVDKLLLMDLLGQYVPFKPSVGGGMVLDQATLDKFNLGRLFQDTKSFRAAHPNGWHEFDLVAGYEYKFVGLSFHVFNLFNAEYTTLPGRLGAQRNYAIQMKFTF